jgi:hypothetical protein
MGRPLWFVAGAGVGVYAAARARRFADSLTADGLRERARSVRLGARLFAEEVQQACVERETELREQLGLVPHGRPELGAGTAPGQETRLDPRPDARPDARRDD